MRAAELRYRCEVCEASAQSGRLATDAELAAIRPGGEENPARGMEGLVRWFGFLCGILERREQTTELREIADAAAVDVLLEQPRTVQVPHPTAPDRTFTIHPKSFAALLECDARDRLLRGLAHRLEALRRIPAEQLTADDHDLLARLYAETSHQLAVLAWISCHPGPGLPWAEGAPVPNPPELYGSLEPVELMLIAHALWQLHGAASRILDHLIAPAGPKGQPEKRMTWSQFFAMAGMQLDMDPKRVMRDRSLTNVLFTVTLANPPRPPKQSAAPPAEPAGAEV